VLAPYGRTHTWFATLLKWVPGAERFFRPNLSGQWFYEVRYGKTEWNPYRNMRVQYMAQILQDGSGKISGDSEKILDLELNGQRRTYVGKWRVRTRVTGQLTFSVRPLGWLIHLHIAESGHERDSSSTHELTAKWGEKSILGTFTTTIANSSGTSHWKRDQFLNF